MNEAVAAGELGETGRARLDSLQRLLATFADVAARRTVAAAVAPGTQPPCLRWTA